MSARRHTDKPDLNPAAVRALGDDHPAMVENRTLFPSTVVTVTETEPDRLLVSGRNNRKIGETVEKGKFKGYKIYMLSLEERATCPTDCDMRSRCYGNGMQMARRHRIGDLEVFYDRLVDEIVGLLDEHETGILIRLHVLGDFPSADYVGMWKDILEYFDDVAVFGYTHRSPKNWGGDEIGDAIELVKEAYPDRFRIRWSSPVSRRDGAIVVDKIPEGPRTANNDIVCPSQRDSTACCATCGLCWEMATEKDCIAFVLHCQKSDAAHAVVIMQESLAPEPLASEESVALPATPSDRRRVQKIALPSVKPLLVPMADAPEVRHVKPTDLIIEASYQRDLSGKSIGLIKKIVGGWDWAKYKPCVCAETPEGLFVIDGQHAAIAAASHPHIVTIPVMVVKRDQIEHRADAFVSQNTSRVVMSPLQIFHAEVVAKKPAAFEMLKSALRAGATIPRSPPKKGEAKPGEVISISALRHVWAHGKPAHFERVLRIAVLSGKAPVNSLLIRGIDLALKLEARDDCLPPIAEIDDAELAWQISQLSDLEGSVATVSVEAECGKYDALALLIESRVWDRSEEYNKHMERENAQAAVVG